MNNRKTKEKIKEYWDERARQNLYSTAATTSDIYLRELEISTVIQTLREILSEKGARILDVGCGDGYSTLKVAETFTALHFLGVDYSENMIKLANERLESFPKLKKNVKFAIGDVSALGKVCSDLKYDIVLTDRCLINLETKEMQSHAIAQIADHTKIGGYYIAIENFIEGHENMNKARYTVGLPEIPVRWHNLYFKEEDFVFSAERFFEDIILKDFSSSYYFATRIIYSAMCQMRGEKPDYNHEIHQLAIRLPWIGQFSPIRMAVMRRK